ncbi:hypothetical protein D3C72_1308600 [compost metagenome]
MVQADAAVRRAVSDIERAIRVHFHAPAIGQGHVAVLARRRAQGRRPGLPWGGLQARLAQRDAAAGRHQHGQHFRGGAPALLRRLQGRHRQRCRYRAQLTVHALQQLPGPLMFGAGIAPCLQGGRVGAAALEFHMPVGGGGQDLAGDGSGRGCAEHQPAASIRHSV